MKQRVVSGVVGALILFAVLAASFWVPVCLNIGIAFVAVVCAWEIAGATGCRPYRSVTAAGMLFSAFLPMVPAFSAGKYPVAFTALCVYAFCLFAHQIFHHKQIPFPNLMTNLGMCALTATSLSCLVRIRDFGQTPADGIFLILLTLIAAWTSDMGAYFVGVRFGKHKLVPEISPKKTVEGFFGGIAGCVLCMELAAVVYHFAFRPAGSISFFAVGLAAAVCSVVSVAGDLSFSLLKRSYGIKDFGNIMPGHGGALDRFDSVIFVAPFLYLLTQYLPIIHA
ncbi:MAG: phosphatidate cytidylyltransferase [Firmicutes bacterium]|nr:phosphatidate cytidylyltransferase [Bacillota bacterium]